MASHWRCQCGKELNAAGDVTGKRFQCPACGRISMFAAADGRAPQSPGNHNQLDLLTADWNAIVPERRLLSTPKKPPPTLRQLLAKHTSWLVPVAACVVFVILIAGMLGVRKIIIRKAGETVALVKRALGTGGPEAATSLEDQRGHEEQVSEEQASLEPDQSGLEVLPPAAAKLAGRKLPRLLFVGRHPQMFQSLAEAVKVVIPGDIIEIRTNALLAEPGVELRWKEKPKDTPLVIRAGRGFQPVLRPRSEVPLLTLVNADLKASGLHFAANCGLLAENSNVHLERCTLTKAGLQARNTRGSGKPLQITMDRCFVRSGSLRCEGPSVAVKIRESGFVEGHGTITVSLDEDQSIVIEQTSIVNCYFLQLRMPSKPPAEPLSFRMDRSVVGAVRCCPVLVHLLLPQSYAKSGTTGLHEALRQAFRECKAGDNFAHYWGRWAFLESAGATSCDAERIFPELPQDDQTLRFGKRVEQTRSLIWGEKQQLEAGMAVFATVLPEDLPVTSTGALGKRIREGVRYGCDPAQLPVPPPLTLQAVSQAPTPAPPAPRK